MKILSLRQGFTADHSSTSYEFYAIDKVLDSRERASVSRLSSRVRPTGRRASFIYNGDWSDLPGGWHPLIEKYYDVMYSESYDWWTLVIAFDAPPDTIKKITEYDYTGHDELGIHVYSKKNRVVIAIHCRMEVMPYQDDYYDYDDNYDDEYDAEYDEDYEHEEANDKLLDLLEANREYLIKGDYRLLHGVMKAYGAEKEDLPAAPPEKEKIPKKIKELLSYIIDDI